MLPAVVVCGGEAERVRALVGRGERVRERVADGERAAVGGDDLPAVGKDVARARVGRAGGDRDWRALGDGAVISGGGGGGNVGDGDARRGRARFAPVVDDDGDHVAVVTSGG